MNHLLRLTETQEESIEKDERHAMLHKNARSNYRVLVDLNYVMSARCTREHSSITSSKRWVGGPIKVKNMMT